jgi:competence protein ComGB
MVDQAQFVSKLGEMLHHGYPLADAILFLKMQMDQKKQADLDASIKGLRNGNPLYVILAEMRFHPQLVSFIYYSEHYGNLAQALKEGGVFWTKRSEDMEKIKKLLVYPLFLFVFVVNVFYLLQQVLLPKFQTLFQSMDTDSNFFLFIIKGSELGFALLPWLTVSGLLSFILFWKFYYKRISPLKRRRFLLKIPLAGTFIKLYETHFFASQFSGLLAGGLSVNESIYVFSENHQQPFYKSLCKIIRRELTEGRPLEDIFATLPYFDNNLSVITANGQKYGRLDQELFHYSRYLLERIEEKMKVLMSIIQPLFFTLIGLMIISIYLAVLLPMFSLMKGI